MNLSILILSTYPFCNPQHGGQVRLANIAKYYRVAGYTVHSIALHDNEKFASSSDICFPIDVKWRQFQGRTIPMISDLLTSKYAISESGGFPLVKAKLPETIDLIHVEQPWLWPLARKIQSMFESRRIVLVYGSQNIEAPLKRELLNKYGVNDTDDLINAIDALDHQAAREADLCLAVTQSDLDTLKLFGAKRVIHSPNGIEPKQANKANIGRWKEILPKLPWPLYVASAHPPNFQDFIKCFGDSLACLPPGSKLVIVGNVCHHIQNEFSLTEHSQFNLSKLQLLHTLSEADLEAVKSLTRTFVLPILSGGGSSLKTAEAIYSGKYVIGSTVAFRGFEHMLDLPEVIIANEPGEFQNALQDILTRPDPSKNNYTNPIRETLRWEYCLKNIHPAIEETLKNE